MSREWLEGSLHILRDAIRIIPQEYLVGHFIPYILSGFVLQKIGRYSALSFSHMAMGDGTSNAFA